MAKLPWDDIRSWTLILGIVSIADPVSILIIDLFRLPAYSWFSLRRLCISRNSTASFRFSSFEGHIVHSILYMWKILFHFLFFFLCLFSFFLSTTKGLSISDYFFIKFIRLIISISVTVSKDQLFVSLMFSTSFFFSLLRISTLIFMIPSFCWLWALLILYLICLVGTSSCLIGTLSCLIEIFLVSWGRHVLLKKKKIHLELLLSEPKDFENLYFFFQLSQDAFWFLLCFIHWPIVFLAVCFFSMLVFFSFHFFL